MILIRHLIELARDGSPEEQDFANYLVASKLQVHPELAETTDFDLAWSVAEDHWERSVERLLQAGLDVKQAELRARNQLLRGAMSRFIDLGWGDSLASAGG